VNVETSLALGIDLGTSGVRIAVLNQQGTLIHSSSAEYATGLTAPLDWAEASTINKKRESDRTNKEGN
jgi:sugar (pentulose or hexulose) kinase